MPRNYRVCGLEGFERGWWREREGKNQWKQLRTVVLIKKMGGMGVTTGLSA